MNMNSSFSDISEDGHRNVENGEVVSNSTAHKFNIRFLVTRENKEFNFEIPPSALKETIFQLKVILLHVR